MNKLILVAFVAITGLAMVSDAHINNLPDNPNNITPEYWLE